jgi:hypothetical protein
MSDSIADWKATRYCAGSSGEFAENLLSPGLLFSGSLDLSPTSKYAPRVSRTIAVYTLAVLTASRPTFVATPLTPISLERSATRLVRS